MARVGLSRWFALVHWRTYTGLGGFVVIMPRGVSLPASSVHVPHSFSWHDVCGEPNLACLDFFEYTDSLFH